MTNTDYESEIEQINTIIETIEELREYVNVLMEVVVRKQYQLELGEEE